MGNQLLTTGSIVAAFFAGGVSLFAPCCIVFLAPSYLAVAVKNRRWRLLPLTFVFAAGLGLVLVPITLGMGLLAGAVARYPAPLYYAGGALMFALALRADVVPALVPARTGHQSRGHRELLCPRGVLGHRLQLLRPGAGGGDDPVGPVRVPDRRPDPRNRLRVRHGVPAVRDGPDLGQGEAGREE